MHPGNALHAEVSLLLKLSLGKKKKNKNYHWGWHGMKCRVLHCWGGEMGDGMAVALLHYGGESFGF